MTDEVDVWLLENFGGVLRSGCEWRLNLGCLWVSCEGGGGPFRSTFEADQFLTHDLLSGEHLPDLLFIIRAMVFIVPV